LTTGTNSSHGLTRLAARYNELTKNGRWLSNQRSIQILRGRMDELLERIDANDMPDRLGKLFGLWKQFRDEQVNDPPKAIFTAMEIDQAFEAARTDFAAWSQLLQVLDLDRKMIESEVKIAKEIKAIMTAEEGVELTAKLLASVITAVGAATIPEYDKGQMLKRVQYEFTRIIGDDIGADSAEGLGDSLAEIIDA
jgi:hypothetical protein